MEGNPHYFMGFNRLKPSHWKVKNRTQNFLAQIRCSSTLSGEISNWFLIGLVQEPLSPPNSLLRRVFLKRPIGGTFLLLCPAGINRISKFALTPRQRPLRKSSLTVKRKGTHYTVVQFQKPSRKGLFRQRKTRGPLFRYN